MRSSQWLAAAIATSWWVRSPAVYAQPAEPFPCKGCILHEPASYSPERLPPLLVVLHGDEGSPTRIAQLWKNPANARGVLLFAPKCPREQGCATGSFWRWGGSPRWLETQVNAVLGRFRVDLAHVYLSGWSGGATYMGMLAPQVGAPFTALNLNGGGHPPADSTQCPPCTLPVYYLAGDRNPLHDLAVANRKYYEACGHDVTWDLLPGKDHAGELAALSKQEKALAILDWLHERSRPCNPSAPAALVNRVASGGGADAAIDATRPIESSAAPSGARPAGEPASRIRSDAARCGCTSTAPPQVHGALVLLLLGAFVARRMLRSAPRSPIPRVPMP